MAQGSAKLFVKVLYGVIISRNAQRVTFQENSNRRHFFLGVVRVQKALWLKW